MDLFAKQLKVNFNILFLVERFFFSIKIFLFLTLFNFILISQIEEDFKHFLTAGKNLVIAPSKFNSNDWIKLASVVGVTGISFFADNNFKSTALHNQANFNDNLFSIDNVYGTTPVTYGIVGLYGIGFIAKEKRIRLLGLKLFEASIYAGLINTSLKFLFGRSRPYLDEGNLKFRPFNLKGEQTALPSGHTTWAFAISTVMANEIDNFYWKAFWYSGAALVGFARIYHNAHWFSDVILGASVGYFVADFINRNDLSIESNNSSQIHYVPYFSKSAIGIIFFL